jgi:hypothetical protein
MDCVTETYRPIRQGRDGCRWHHQTASAVPSPLPILNPWPAAPNQRPEVRDQRPLCSPERPIRPV